MHTIVVDCLNIKPIDPPFRNPSLDKVNNKHIKVNNKRFVTSFVRGGCMCTCVATFIWYSHVICLYLLCLEPQAFLGCILVLQHVRRIIEFSAWPIWKSHTISQQNLKHKTNVMYALLQLLLSHGRINGNPLVRSRALKFELEMYRVIIIRE